ncbi:MAG TPA: DedA family protein [Burkholderiales bacterium]|jgi:membrane-associated protein|nr:DedA family protein [Burkholderiales bacterium]
MQGLIDLFLHLDVHLAEFVERHGNWVYGLLFAIVFAETGLVVTPFLPGDSLLFAAGALAATGALDVKYVLILLVAAAVIGNMVNYAIGRFIGPRIFRADQSAGGIHRLLNREHLDRAHAFFERYGGMAVVLTRFVPIIRTFVPFVAGAGAMRYSTFALYNVAGGVLWVGVCVGAGYAFGNVPIIKQNFTLVALGIVAVSLIPVAIEWLKSRKKGQRSEPLP